MRGEHCVAGASILSAISVILLVFVNIGQIKTGAVTSGLYFLEVNVAPYGSTFSQASGVSADGMYNTDVTDPMGSSMGLPQYYRYGIYNACGYQKDGSGNCNKTIFGYPFEGRNQIIADLPAKFKAPSVQVSANTAFNDTSYNYNTSRAGSLMIFVGSCLALLALIVGLIKARTTFLLATAFSSLSALLLLVGAACWTALVAKNKIINDIYAAGKYPLGWIVGAGPSLYLTWASFALMVLATVPYVISFFTFRRNN